MDREKGKDRLLKKEKGERTAVTADAQNLAQFRSRVSEGRVKCVSNDVNDEE